MKLYLFATLILFTACMSNTGFDNDDITSLLEKNTDYDELNQNFIKNYNRNPEFEIVEYTKLIDEIAAQRLKELVDNPYLNIYTNLTPGENYFVKLQEKTEKNRGIIAVIDVTTREVKKLYGTLDIELSKEVENE
ncbi:MAG: hypothetical protein AABW88_04400 [Nanoarchaeota archaeon]